MNGKWTERLAGFGTFGAFLLLFREFLDVFPLFAIKSTDFCRFSADVVKLLEVRFEHNLKLAIFRRNSV